MRNLARAAAAAALLAGLSAGAVSALSQERALAHGTSEVRPMVNEEWLGGLRFRSLGPYRGGRVTAVDSVPGRPFTFLMGATGGGVWRTDNAGHTWDNVTDGFLAHGAIGAIEVAAADPNVIYVGTGSACMRGNVSIGVGMYRSTDAGRSWDFVGLPRAGQIGRVIAHPDNADLVYVAATGNPFGPNEERGVYRSGDGGASWERVLYVSDAVGAVDLAMDPRNPRVLYAAMWRGERKPWTMISGSEDGGLFKSTDGGTTWDELGGGFPEGLVGKIGVTVSPANPERVWAMVEADEDRTGLYRSDDAGANWRLISTQGGIAARPWYYMHVVADPVDADTVYALNSGFYRSIDGGATFESVPMPHSDHHDLWIDPDNTEVMLVGSDGGATLTLDGGHTWSPQLNQPTAEIYSLTVDDAYPYRLYGPQQDNSTISVPSQATHSGISLQHWLSVGGCETGPIAIKPDDPDVFYAGCFGGRLARYDRRSEQFRQIRDYPEDNSGMPESELRYRVQWNAPITTSRHRPEVLYHGSQYVHRTTNEGQSWEVISPDLTGIRTEMFGPAGGPITHDITGVEVYSALLAIEEDRVEPGVIWTGSNDGVVSISRDDGATWTNVTPPGLPELSTVNRIEPSPHRAGKAYVTAYRYRVDDWAPYVFRTFDYGMTWERIADGTRGLPAEYPVRVVREDPGHERVLYAGTEFGLFWSVDDGDRWQSLQLNLPRTPVSDLRLVQGDLVVATQGRGFWVLDDVSVLHELADGFEEPVLLFAVSDVIRNGASVSDRDYPRDHVYGAMLPRAWMGENPPDGAVIDYWIEGEAPGPLTLEVLDAADRVMMRRGSDDASEPLPVADGVNRVVWNLQVPDPELSGRFGSGGPRAVPGAYTARLIIGDPEGEYTMEHRFEVWADPRLRGIMVADLQAQFDFLERVRDNVRRLQRTLRQVRSVREQLTQIAPRLEGVEREDDLHESLRLIGEELDLIESGLVQTEGSGWAAQPRVQRNLGWLYSAASSQRGERTDARPTDQLVERLADVEAMLEDQVQAFEILVDHDLDDLNLTLIDLGVPAIVVGTPAPARRVAITIDDLPANMFGGDLSDWEGMTRDLLDGLVRHGVPAIGFVNESKLYDGGEAPEPARVALLQAWIDAGLELGNHTYSHPDLHSTPLAEFQQDVLQGEIVTRELLATAGETPRYFRHPFLHTGTDLATRDALHAFLVEHGYGVAPVTIDNQEWIAARAYDHALVRGDDELAARIASTYVEYMGDMFGYYEQQSEALLGHELPQVLLIHANRLNADVIDALVATIRNRGYEFVSLGEALMAPAYDSADEFIGTGGITWLHRWALTAGHRGAFFAGEPELPAFVHEAYQDRPR